MAEYQKINTLFKRDAKNVIIPSQWVNPLFEELRGLKWEATEKIDGTNIRIEIADGKIEIHGKTDAAVLPQHLQKRLEEIFTEENVTNMIGEEWKMNPEFVATIYGEGYGVKIQKGGNYIKDGVDFILFDVKIGRWWLNREALEDIAEKGGLKIVPVIGEFTIDEAIDYVKKGFKSTIAENPDYDAEGLVLRTKSGLLDRSGQRIIVKIKTCDFRKFAAVYGEGYTGPQPVNTKYGQE